MPSTGSYWSNIYVKCEALLKSQYVFYRWSVNEKWFWCSQKISTWSWHNMVSAIRAFVECKNRKIILRKAHKIVLGLYKPDEQSWWKHFNKVKENRNEKRVRSRCKRCNKMQWISTMCNHFGYFILLYRNFPCCDLFSIFIMSVKTCRNSFLGVEIGGFVVFSTRFGRFVMRLT